MVCWPDDLVMAGLISFCKGQADFGLQENVGRANW